MTHRGAGSPRQINCSLYEDSCLWVVPGSHLRGDTPEEIARFPTRPVPAPSLDDCGSDEERYEKCVEYARSMPGAFQVVLQPGDFCIYRNTLWRECSSGCPSLSPRAASDADGCCRQPLHEHLLRRNRHRREQLLLRH